MKRKAEKNHPIIFSNLQNRKSNKLNQSVRKKHKNQNNRNPAREHEQFERSEPQTKRRTIDSKFMIKAIYHIYYVTLINKTQRMFYINTRKKVQPIKQKQLLDAILIPPQERLTKDHQTIYRFFHNHEMLMELERTKSLNSRIKCIAALILISQDDFNQQEQIIMHSFEDLRIIVLPKSVKKNAEQFNQKIIRKKMDLISGFSMMKPLKYEQLLYFAYNMQQQSCKYKDYLYREGQEPEYFYLIVKGQFNYVKDCSDIEQNINKKKNKGNKMIKLKSLQGEQQIPNKAAKPHTTRYNIGIVSGSLGQAVGLQQLLLQQSKQSRKYSLICSSTDNLYVKIHKKYLETILQDIPSYHQFIVNQVKQGIDAKKELFQKIKNTKLQMAQYLQKKSQNHSDKQHEDEEQQMRKLQKLNESPSAGRYKLPFVSKKSSFSLDDRSRNRSRIVTSVLTINLKSQQNQTKPLKSQSQLNYYEEKQYQQNEAFGLTGIKDENYFRSISKSNSKLNVERYPSDSKQIGSYDSGYLNEDLNLPSIGKKSIADLDGTSINLQQSHKYKGRMHQYGGMIDTQKLIMEKQSILDRIPERVKRTDIFPIGHIEYKHPKNIKIEDPMKLKASPAHSNRFMEKMLLKVLRKAGYDEAITQIHQIKQVQRQNSRTVDIKHPHSELRRSMSKTKKRVQTNRNKTTIVKQELLVNSAFDQCFFAKI